MNRIRMIAGGAALLLLGMAQPASAQYTFYNICSPGAMRACASAEVTMQGEDLVMRVWNMNGRDGRRGNDLSSYSMENGGWHTITAVGLRGVQYTVSPGGSVATYVNKSGDPRTLRRWGEADAGALIDGTDIAVAANTRQGIIGCYDPDQSGVLNNVRTCDENAYVQFTFTGLSDVDLTNASFVFHSTAVGADFTGTAAAEGGTVIASGVAEATAPPTTVTPEPITMVLMGSGLAGIAAARRRKKQGKSDEAII